MGEVPEGEMALRAEEGRLADVGEVGEIMLRGPSVMPGYLGDDINAAPVGLTDGWLATGDLGVRDDRGNLKVIARTKEIINRGGEKVSPYDVERALLAHPAVRQAAAFPIPHERLGESVCSAAVLHAGAEASSAELLEFITTVLGRSSARGTVHLLDELPVGPTGKISRAQLSRMFSREQVTGPLPDAPLELLIADIWRKSLKREDVGAEEDFFEIGGDFRSPPRCWWRSRASFAGRSCPPRSWARVSRSVDWRKRSRNRLRHGARWAAPSRAAPERRSFFATGIFSLGLLWISSRRDVEDGRAGPSAPFPSLTHTQTSIELKRWFSLYLPYVNAEWLRMGRSGSAAIVTAGWPRSSWPGAWRRPAAPSRKSSW